MECRRCNGTDLPDDARICPQCGAPLRKNAPLVAGAGVGCAGIALASGGFFLSCASDIVTSYSEAAFYRGVMWFGFGLIALAAILFAVSLIRR